MKDKIKEILVDVYQIDGRLEEEAAERILQLFTIGKQLPDFLYEDDGQIKIGYHGDTVVTDEWNEWIKNKIYK